MTSRPTAVAEPPVAVVTGAASGIGLAVTRQLAGTHRVALLDINDEAAQQAAQELGAAAIAVRAGTELLLDFSPMEVTPQ
jgi:NAD(P)-dependent dehydrogenase (short-subunit alcohol dehydrogenase family)